MPAVAKCPTVAAAATWAPGGLDGCRAARLPDCEWSKHAQSSVLCCMQMTTARSRSVVWELADDPTPAAGSADLTRKWKLSLVARQPGHICCVSSVCGKKTGRRFYLGLAAPRGGGFSLHGRGLVRADPMGTYLELMQAHLCHWLFL